MQLINGAIMFNYILTNVRLTGKKRSVDVSNYISDLSVFLCSPIRFCIIYFDCLEPWDCKVRKGKYFKVPWLILTFWISLNSELWTWLTVLHRPDKSRLKSNPLDMTPKNTVFHMAMLQPQTWKDFLTLHHESQSCQRKVLQQCWDA